MSLAERQIKVTAASRKLVKDLDAMIQNAKHQDDADNFRYVRVKVCDILEDLGGPREKRVVLAATEGLKLTSDDVIVSKFPRSDAT